MPEDTRNEEGYKPHVPEETIDFFMEQTGLSREQLTDTYADIYSLPHTALRDRFEALGSYVGLDGSRLVRKLPVIMGHSSKSVASRMQMFGDLGFDAVSLVNRKPQIMSHAPETVADRFAGLAKRGLDAHKIIQFIPGALGVNEERLDKLFTFLEEQGLDARRTINAAPAILPLSIDPASESSLPAKIRNLEAMGFDAAVLLAKYPKALCSSPETMKKKLTILGKITRGIGSGVLAQDVALHAPINLTRSSESMWVAAQLTAATGSYQAETAAQVNSIIQAGPEAALRKLVGLDELPNDVQGRKASIFERLLSVDGRKDIGAFAVLTYMSSLKPEQQAMVQASIESNNDIKLLPIVAR